MITQNKTLASVSNTVITSNYLVYSLNKHTSTYLIVFGVLLNLFVLCAILRNYFWQLVSADLFLTLCVIFIVFSLEMLAVVFSFAVTAFYNNIFGEKKLNLKSLVFFGFFASLSVTFRLEMYFVIIELYKNGSNLIGMNDEQLSIIRNVLVFANLISFFAIEAGVALVNFGDVRSVGKIIENPSTPITPEITKLKITTENNAVMVCYNDNKLLLTANKVLWWGNEFDALGNALLYYKAQVPMWRKRSAETNTKTHAEKLEFYNLILENKMTILAQLNALPAPDQPEVEKLSSGNTVNFF